MKESSGKRTFWILKEQVACQRCNKLKQNNLLLLKPFPRIPHPQHCWGSLAWGKSKETEKEKKQPTKYLLFLCSISYLM